MRSITLVLIVLTCVGFANAAYYIAGDFNGWNAAGQLMTDNGDGTYTTTISGLAADSRHEFKVTDGTWGWNRPQDNGWLYADASGNVTITFNANNVSDGWQPAQYRIGLSTDPGSWTVAGNFQGWNNADPTSAMTPIQTALGDGIYLFTLPAGSYIFKPVVTGSWDSIGSDERSTGTADYSITVSEPLEIYVDAFRGVMGVQLGIERTDRAHVPAPAHQATNVPISGLELSWAVAVDPNGLADPNLVGHKVYMRDASATDPNLIYKGTVTGWDTGTLRASYVPSPALNKDKTYQWRVDMVFDDATEIQGKIWTFSTEITTPSVTDPGYQVVAAGGTAVFQITATSPSTPSYQWYKYVDGISDMMLTNGGDIAGVATNTLTIANVELADEGGYYCIVNNDSGVPAQSAQGLLGVERLLARWDFESGNANSTVAGSPTSVFYHDPNLVTTGIVGDAMEFDNDAGAQDILYTDPDEASYFDICNHSMTVGCWIKSGFAATWGPMVARNGELNEAGWQLRHSGFSQNRACFTTRGTSNEDGTFTNRPVYDDQWHYVAATFTTTEKKVYIDGVLCRVYSGDEGSVVKESDTTGSRIIASPSPVALGGRVSGDSNGLNFFGDSVSPCILDEVEIYNYALTAATIAQNYANVTGTPVCPVPQSYDLDNDCVVNLNDFALLASEWLSDIRVQPIL